MQYKEIIHLVNSDPIRIGQLLEKKYLKIYDLQIQHVQDEHN